MKRIIAIMLMPILFLFGVNSTSAAELNFSVTAEIPENQIDKNQTYFDLRMKPKQRQTVNVEMNNGTDKDVTVNISMNTAVTNNNGIIDYSQTEYEKDESLEYEISELVKVDPEVTIPANSKKTLPVEINMPDREFDGILLGGLHFQEKEDEEEEEEETQIKNKFAYIIGLQVSMTDLEIEPNLELNEVKASQVNYRNKIIANLQNTESVIIKPLSVDAKVYKEKGKDVLYEAQQEDLRMAPNSNFNYAIDLNNEAFKSGKYRLEMTATDEEEVWEWTEVFEIDAGEASELNESAVELEKDYTIWLMVAGIILVLILILILVYLNRRQKRNIED